MDNQPFWLQPESRRLEFKETWPGGSQIAHTAIGFANGAGGRFVFGVKDEPRNIIGIPEDEIFKLEEKAANHIFDQCSPSIIPEIYLQNVEGKNLLVIEIYPGYQKPYFLKNKGKHKGTYIRVGSANRLASEETLISLERAGRKISFDEVVLYDLKADELDIEKFKTDYTKISGKTINEKKLRNLGLLSLERNQLYPTQAAVLLSESTIKKRLFPYAKIECARFKGTETKVFLDQITADGPIHASIEPCMAFIKRNIALGSTIGEIYREDRWEYPLEAVREALINAVIHRDYSILGSDIKVAIFDDMLEITSPGPLPDNLPPEALGSGRSEIRNRTLAPIFKDLKMIEAWGTGIQKMHIENEKYPEIELNIKEIDNAFQIQFIKEISKDIAMDDTMDVAMDVTMDVEWLKKLKGEMNRAELQSVLKLKNDDHFRKAYLVPAMEAGLIEMTHPDKPRSVKQKYRLTSFGRKILNKDME